MPGGLGSFFGGGGGGVGHLLGLGGGDGGLLGSGSILSPIGDLLGKPDVGQYQDLSGKLEDIVAAEQIRRLALQEPLRRTIFGTDQGGGQLGDFLTTGHLPLSLNTPFTATQEAITSQGQNVRNDIVNRIGASGGQLRDLLLNQRLNEANQIAQLPLLELPTRQALWQQALGTSVGQEFPIVPGFGVAGNILSQGDTANNQFKGNIAGIVGLGAGLAA